MSNLEKVQPILLTSREQANETGIVELDTKPMEIGIQYGASVIKRDGKRFVLLVQLADPESEK